MKLYFVFLFLFIGINVHAKEEHRHHDAHVHGAGTLGIAFDQAKGTLEFKIPSESIFGFEHSAKSEADKKAINEGLQKLETKITEMVVFDSSLKCQFSKDKLEVVKEKEGKDEHKNDHHSEHSETVANFTVTCAKSPVGTKLTFNFQKFFPRIKDLDVTFLAENIQASAEAKKNGTVLVLEALHN
jgi:hypothetical protein